MTENERFLDFIMSYMKNKHHPQYLCLTKDQNGLTLSQMINIVLFQLKEFPDNTFKFDENGIKFTMRVENTVGKGEIARYE